MSGASLRRALRLRSRQARECTCPYVDMVSLSRSDHRDRLKLRPGFAVVPFASRLRLPRCKIGTQKP
jgi:hypothetical protein